VPPRDPGALAAAAGRLLAEPQLREQMGQLARRRAEERFSWERVAAATEDSIRSVIFQKKEATA
ncbi:glycosyltransferase, partial [Ornithinicoccus halotolerans]|uniref:glycosyltransferase n=1 Tax=Ornithinicoccus halotolerans TaxID=1748220 RepID=UPI001E32C7FA